ncbi:DNA-formamidopyrimidine glycosylase family protein [Pedobacter endophyticus]|uniref:Endonuclease n=1 Tax=Pedobacter endophyticus TaxID=2789740 RepID=A0A7S9L1J3_9SPHI|nr:DNA-formamidopyrimidine glycosylase family protein [Pedobacter endophyticus]QPH40786.1 endonuclease [Pedobacter endophyticus]
MPEGPSIVILRDQIKALNLGKPEVLEVAGYVKTIDKEQLIGEKIKDFKSWGKHFLICFNDFTIRIHFMLFGTYLINAYKQTPLALGLTFKKDELNFYTCKVELLEGNVDELYDWRVDVMADEWDEKLAVKTLREHPDSYICDLLLDQHIFAGVGNIIKNEVLYRARIHPLSKPEKIPLKKLRELVRQCQQYSFEFLKWKKENTLSKHWEVYKQKECPNGHKVEKKKTGKSNRQTYYCTECQIKCA